MTPAGINLLVIDDDETERRLFEIYCLDLKGVIGSCRFAAEVEKGVAAIARQRPDLVFLDNRLRLHQDFTRSLPVLRQAGYQGPVVVMSASLFDPVFETASDHGVAACIDKLDLSAALIGELAERLVTAR